MLDECVYHIWCALLHVAEQEAAPVLRGRVIACSAARRLPPRGALCAAPPPGCGLGVLGRRRARAVRQPGQPRSAHRQPRLEELRAQHGGKAAPLPGGSSSGSHRGHGVRQCAALGRSVLSVRTRPEARGDPTLPSRGQSSPGCSIGLRTTGGGYPCYYGLSEQACYDVRRREPATGVELSTSASVPICTCTSVLLRYGVALQRQALASPGTVEHWSTKLPLVFYHSSEATWVSWVLFLTQSRMVRKGRPVWGSHCSNVQAVL